MNKFVMAMGLLWMLLSATVQAGTVTYVYTDPQGTILATTDAQGNVTARYDYAPYGTQALGNPPNGPGYTGHVNDPDTGLVYMQARYYLPDVHFLSPDPVAPVPGNVYSFNRYDYANNNPVTYIDPDGKETVYQYPDGHLKIVQTFNNKGTQFSNSQIAQQAKNLSGTASDGTKIIVVLQPGKDADAVQINSNPKLNDLSANGADRSHTDKIGGKDIEIAPNAQGPGTVGHEMGHVLKAGDQYKGGLSSDGKTYLTSDVPGPVNIMKNAVGNANQQTEDEIKNGSTSKEVKHISCSSSTSGC